MQTEIQWCISSDMQCSDQRGAWETREQAEEQAKLHGYPYVVEEILAMGNDDVKDVQRNYFRVQ